MKKTIITTAAAALLLAGCASSQPTSLTEDVYNSMSPNAQQQMLNCQMDELAAEASMSKAGDETGKVMMEGSEAEAAEMLWNDGYGPTQCEVLLPGFEGGE